MALKLVYEPIRIGAVEIPNRVVRTAHGTHFASVEITDRFIDYHEARARGGCGLTILEIASVHPSSVGTVRNFDASIVPGYRRLMHALRPHGMRVFQQLHHGGTHFPGLDGIAWSASDVAGPYGVVPQPMTKVEIDALIAAFAAAAARCREGGLDGVELHAAHGYIFHQFLSTLTNRRQDEYGGTLENRMRFLLETARAVRKAAGNDFPLGMRLSATQSPGGVTEADNVAVVRALEKEGLVDFVDVSFGDYFRMASMNAAMDAPVGYELPSSGQIAAAATVPRIVAGRFRTLEEAEQVLREGTADMVSMVRAHIADPDIVRKTREGRAEDVRPCVACNQGCIGGVFSRGALGCLVNPAVGFERHVSESAIKRAARPRKVLIVGGGPAGLEAARVAALAGHNVILAEASASLGGAVNAARRAPYLHTLGDITQWLEEQVYKLGVHVQLGTYMDADSVRAERADTVIIATGSQPRMDGVQALTPWEPATGADLPHVKSSIDLLCGPKPSGTKTALVLDDVGHYEAIAVTDFLIAQGIKVNFVTRHTHLTPIVETTQRTTSAMERFNAGGVRVMTNMHLSSIEAGQCTVRPIRGSGREILPAELVVLVTANAARSEIYDELRSELPDVRRIGDAASPRDAQFAIAEARHVVMQLA